MTRRKFSREFKIEAVRLVTDRGVAVAQAARDLDVAESVLRRWMRELTATPATAFPGNGQMRADLAEIAALKKEVARLRAERDILKKAAWLLESPRRNQHVITPKGREVLAVERWGEMPIAGVTLSGRFDRIDTLSGGGLAIVDYKTGKAPSPKAVAAGYSLQLGLIGAIAEADYVVCSGFENDEQETAETYRPRLEQMLARDLVMICANPDLIVERGSVIVWKSGAGQAIEVARLGPGHWFGEAGLLHHENDGHRVGRDAEIVGDGGRDLADDEDVEAVDHHDERAQREDRHMRSAHPLPVQAGLDIEPVQPALRFHPTGLSRPFRTPPHLCAACCQAAALDIGAFRYTMPYQ